MKFADTSFVIRVWDHLIDAESLDGAAFLFETMFEYLEYIESLDHGTATDEMSVRVREWLMYMLDDSDGHNFSLWYNLFRNDSEQFQLFADGFVASRITRNRQCGKE